ncbi:MAG: YbjN domain-containing protein [Gemmatimonadetes bacterium]|nr:CesT family type III secretion system chaperone [Gemmatimonadota bacterium]MDE2677843.1 CesT family type III secretion system chaperone [Gemmatimonadota bacterium]MXX34282.1 YbjN domain-containing protein [Gemmatimonadota bacterium]MYA11829.1 YbjN domain-containing protein [Gemmatimonadota bacterium]MYD14498.1 YbjN domain-containing protein [Gemmatimonadota bacterium]
MVTQDDLESYLIRMDADFEEVDDGMFLVRTENGGAPIVVHHSEPVLLIRMKVMDLSANSDALCGLYETLLKLNATDMVHGAYGIEEGELIISDTLQLGSLDFEELQASLESVQLAASSHLSDIRALAGNGEDDQE